MTAETSNARWEVVAQRQAWYEQQIALAEGQWAAAFLDRWECGDDVPSKEHYVALWLAERAAPQQGQAVELAPPSAPVVVEGLLADLETIWHSVSDDKETNAAYERLKIALAQQPAAVDEAMVFRLAVWMAKQDGHDDPHHLIWEGSPPVPWGEIWMRYEDDARSALTAALATQHQEPKS